MEIALRRLDGVDKVSISMAEQRFQVTYKPGATFDPAQIRRAVAEADVKVVQFRISAEGRVREERGKRFFMAGKNKFLLARSPENFSAGPSSIEGMIDDSVVPLQLKILQSRSLK